MKNIILFCSILCLAAGCKNFFDTTLELPTPEHTPVLAVTGFINSTATDSISVRVGRTYDLFEERPSGSSDILSGAVVKLYEEGNLFRTFTETASTNMKYRAYIDNVFGGVGKEYRLEVAHPDYATVSATQVMPVPVPLTSVSVREIEDQSSFEFATGEFTIKWDDPADQENFYEVVAFRDCYSPLFDDDFNLIFDDEGNIVTDTFESEVFLNPNNVDPSIARGIGDGILISDRTFNGESYGLVLDFSDCQTSFFFDEEEEEEQDFDPNYRIAWRTVTKAYFNYSQSLAANQEGQFNPLAEPVSVFTNFDNGVGAFCLRTEVIYEVE